MKPNFDPDDESGFVPSKADIGYVPTSPGYDANDNPDIEVTEDELAALKDEVDVLHGGKIDEAADTLLQEKVLPAIISISKLATQATAERVRLDASKYIVERVLGPLSKLEKSQDLAKDPVYRLLLDAGMIKE